VIEERESGEKHVKNVIDHIEHLLKEGSTADCIIDYCNVSVDIYLILFRYCNYYKFMFIFRAIFLWPIRRLLEA